MFWGDLLLSEVTEDGNAESLKYVEDVEQTGYDLGEVTDDILPTDRRSPGIQIQNSLFSSQHIVHTTFLREPEDRADVGSFPIIYIKSIYTITD